MVTMAKTMAGTPVSRVSLMHWVRLGLSVFQLRSGSNQGSWQKEELERRSSRSMRECLAEEAILIVFEQTWYVV